MKTQKDIEKVQFVKSNMIDLIPIAKKIRETELKEEIENNLTKWQRFAFWYCAIITLGFYFVLPYIFDNITPKELIKYVYGIK